MLLLFLLLLRFFGVLVSTLSSHFLSSVLPLLLCLLGKQCAIDHEMDTEENE